MNSSRSRAGFTLIEMLVVMAILAVLIGIGVTVLPALLGRGPATAAKSYISTLTAALEAYKSNEGAYPPTSLEGFPGVGPLGNTENLGIESLVVCLNSKLYNGSFAFDESKGGKLGNLDGDATQVQLTRFGSGVESVKEMFEVLDPWGTPYAYFNAHDYRAAYANPETFGKISDCDEKAKPVMNPKTKSFYRDDKFQIISAGPDRKFGTDDDIYNFDRE